MKKKLIILGFLLLTLIGIFFISSKIKENNKYKSDYNLVYDINSIYNDKDIFSSYVSANLENNDLISQDLFNYSDILETSNYINVYNKPTSEVKSEIENFFGVENDLFDKIKEDTISYTYFIKNSQFAYQFDISGDTFGMTTNSESGLNSISKINYVVDANNYSMSLIDNSDTELIYMHTDSLEGKSYLELYNEYLDHYCESTQQLLFGDNSDDSVLFPIINVIIDTNINDELVSNYYCGGRINISGTGTFLGINNKLDKSNIKYNFTENSVLFIKRQDCQYPNLIIPCQKSK